MFAMRDEEAFVMVVLMASAVAIVLILQRARVRAERMRTIQKAIESGNLDEVTRRTLVEALADDARHQRELWNSVFQSITRGGRNIVFVGGWLTLTIGGVILLGMWMTDASRFDIQGAIIAVAIGFGLVTLPLALRELHARRSLRN